MPQIIPLILTIYFLSNSETAFKSQYEWSKVKVPRDIDDVNPQNNQTSPTPWKFVPKVIESDMIKFS